MALRKEDVHGRGATATLNHISEDGKHIVRDHQRFPTPAPPTLQTTVEDVIDAEAAWNLSPPESLPFANNSEPTVATPVQQVQKFAEQGPKTFVTIQWNGKFFEATTLQSLGFILQLGHPHGEPCLAPTAASRNFMVMHTNGFHSMTVQYCQCDKQYRAGTSVQQLLRYELYPATLDNPSTCCTFRLLETFHMLTLQSKVTHGLRLLPIPPEVDQ
ncbi:hypothetical protein PsYK624_171380 [Phanerochaete sordida]|uniref:CxC2-like cysteine cluster KDZ transposase-associated domain-containing protein n=1 Tax=Phanerochaete sordida TaxID=48140 RepID=A0A9P3GS23_9APHY|nr:hypothetical protein PsYK624_171380 [Phanerochaete sordida]